MDSKHVHNIYNYFHCYIYITTKCGEYRTVINRVSRLVYMSLGVIVEGLYFVLAFVFVFLVYMYRKR